MALAVSATGCESTQDQSKRLAKEGKKAFSEKGLTVGKESKEVKVGKRVVLHDSNGTAVAVRVENTSGKPLVKVPVSIDVKDGAKKSVFKNNAAGLQPALVSLPVIQPHQSYWWVNDQVQETGAGKSVDVRIGKAQKPPKVIPNITLTKPKLENDPVSGISVTGQARNTSKVLQKQLIMFCVALKNGKVVAAGRGGIEKLRPGRKAGYQIFFIGNPRGAQYQLTAPASILQ